MNEFLNNIPEFDFEEVFVIPWSEFGDSFIWIFLMGFFVTATCGMLGSFIVWRRMALVGDAISHSVLPGIVIAFLVTQSRDTMPMFIGALSAGVLTTVLIEFIHSRSRVKTDAALGIVFTTLFAIGVVLVSIYGENVDLDTDCVLYGEIEYVSEDTQVASGPLAGVPLQVARMGLVAVAVLLLMIVFYRQLLVCSFDPGMAQSMGVSPAVVHHGLMILLSIAVVSAFEAVGAVLVISMLIFPATTASMLSDRMPVIMGLTVLIAALTSFFGMHLALWLDVSTAGAMSVVVSFWFGLAWVFSPRRGLLARVMKKKVDLFAEQN